MTPLFEQIMNAIKEIKENYTTTEETNTLISNAIANVDAELDTIESLVGVTDE